jgi:MFS family permease
MTATASASNRNLVNVWVLSFAFFGMFVAYSSVQNLESSIHANVGSWSIGTIYLAMTSMTLVSPVIVARLGPKWSEVLGGVCFVIYMAVNIKDIPWLLISASVVLGVGASVLWTAQGVYLSACARLHASEHGQEESSFMGSFNGIFFGVFQLNALTGNLLGAVLLQRKASTSGLFVVFVCLAAFSVVCFLFLRRIPSADLRKTTASVTLKDLFVLHKNYLMYLLVPLIVYNGLAVAFLAGDFSKDAVKKNLAEPGVPESGTHWVGYVLAVNSAANILGSVLFGRLSDKVGRAPIILVGFLSQASFIALCLITDFAAGAKKEYVVLFIAAGLFGFGDAAWNTQINSMLGSYHADNPDAAFAAFKMWQSGATSAAFFYGPKVSFESKLWNLTAWMGFAIASYVFLEKRRRSEDKDGVYREF